MSILIKGMELPKSCPCELAGIGYDLYCSFVHGIPARVREYDECCEKGTRPDWCPCIEVPEPHGRLIDADAVILEDGPYEYDEWCEWALRQYQAAPTVIPASPESEGG